MTPTAIEVNDGARSPSTALVRRPDEVRALSRLSFEEFGRAAGGIGGMHTAIAGRVFRYVGAGAAPVRVVHDTIAGGVYGGLRGATTLLGRGADTVLAQGAVTERRVISTTRRGSALIGAVTGLIGDQLEREESDLVEPLAVRVDGCAVPPARDALAAAFPDATPRLVVFVHGLMGTEHYWRIGEAERGTYATRLAEDLGTTAIDVRYNTGRHVSENGASLDELVEALVDAWPVPVDEIALVGHSMGGLVARSACHHGSCRGAACTGRVRHVVSLG